MKFKEYIETKYNLTLDEPFSFYNEQWCNWAEEYANYICDLQQPTIQGDSTNLEILDSNPDDLDPSFVKSYGNGYR